MKHLIILVLLILISCRQKQDNKVKTTTSQEQRQDTLFVIDINENVVNITTPTNTEYSLPDSSYALNQYKEEDFNNDNKKDVLLNMGACGTVGCVYAVFLNQQKKQYKLAFEDYLKSPELIEEENGCLNIKSYEETEAYNPSKRHFS